MLSRIMMACLAVASVGFGYQIPGGQSASGVPIVYTVLTSSSAAADFMPGRHASIDSVAARRRVRRRVRRHTTTTTTTTRKTKTHTVVRSRRTTP